jgi:hypothetical protein
MSFPRNGITALTALHTIGDPCGAVVSRITVSGGALMQCDRKCNAIEAPMGSSPGLLTDPQMSRRLAAGTSTGLTVKDETGGDQYVGQGVLRHHPTRTSDSTGASGKAKRTRNASR